MLMHPAALQCGNTGAALLQNFVICKHFQKLGILYWTIEKHWYGKEDVYNRIIPCEYDRIEKADGYFACYKGTEVTYIDLKGNILK